MPPGGKSKSIFLIFSPVQALISMKVTRTSHRVAIHDVVKFQHYPDKITGDIHYFVDTVSLNEMEIEQSLQSESMKLKSSHITDEW